MKVSAKKIIAREFLLLMIVSFIGLFTFLGTYFYNLYLENKKNNLENQFRLETKTKDSLVRNQINPEIISFTSAGPIIQFEKGFIYLYKENETNLSRILKQMKNLNKPENEKQIFFTNFSKKHSLKLDTVYNTKDGQQVTKSELLYSGYTEPRISKGLENGILTILGGLAERKISVTFPDGANVIITEAELLTAVSKGAKWSSGPDEIIKVPINPKKYLRNKDKLSSLLNNEKELALQIKNLDSKILSFDKRLNFSLGFLLVCATVVFLVRYVIYGISWSFKTLKYRE